MGRPNLCLADFIAPKETGIQDFIGTFAVSTGFGIDALIKSYEKKNDDYSAIILKALADRLAEAFAEHLHARIRQEFWGYANNEILSNEQLVAEEYRGIRPAPGYPACPDHTEKGPLFELLQVPDRTGITITESYAMIPTAAVSGFYFSHPKADYFAIGKIDKRLCKKEKLDTRKSRRMVSTGTCIRTIIREQSIDILKIIARI